MAKYLIAATYSSQAMAGWTKSQVQIDLQQQIPSRKSWWKSR